MDALIHAESVLAAVHRKYPERLVPGYVGSPMDDMDTVTIPRAFIEACDTLAHAGDSAVDRTEPIAMEDPDLIDAEMMRAVIGRTLEREEEQRRAAG
jgi:hypothetical protein